MMKIRDTEEKDFSRIITLNDLAVQHTSPMDRERLEFLHRLASYSKVATVEDEVAAFLLAIKSDAVFENDNFSWFSGRLSSFLYVDRIVVDGAHAGQKIGSQLYEDLFVQARSLGVERIACEYNIKPPNPASKAFHTRFGFRELGTQWLAGRTKQVSLQAAEL